jgi:hypothetical protein
MGGFGGSQPLGDQAAHHQNGVGETLRGHERGLRARARNERVVADGAGVEKKSRRPDEVFLVAQPDVAGRVAHRVDGADGKIIGRRQSLSQRNRTVFVDGYAVGKSAPDVDSQNVTHKRIRTSAP